ncbi:potassium/sodium hyperpolarization-activated cyclic nucleotide-gated channel 1-like [Amblyomma americanum]
MRSPSSLLSSAQYSPVPPVSPDTPRARSGRSAPGSITSLMTPLHAPLHTPLGGADSAEHSLDDKPSRQVHALKSNIKKMLTASSRRQYSGLDFKKRAPTKHRFVFHPRSRFRRWWDAFIMLTLLMNMVLVPLQLGFFRQHGNAWALYSLLLDGVLFADLLLNFRTGIDDRKQGIVIMDPQEISGRYLRGWFAVDFVSSMPLDFIVWMVAVLSGKATERRSTLWHLAKLMSLVKLVKISRLFRYGGRTEQMMFYQTTGVYLQLGNILALIFLAVHWHACLQFFVGFMMGFPPESWISIANLQNEPWWVQYSWAVHNTVSLMMTNNYGLAQKTGLLVEEWIQVMGMFFGALWQALLLGYGANLLAHKDYTKNVQRERMQEVEEFMAYYDLPERLQARIRSHLHAQQMYLNDKDILSSLSGTLREQVLRHNYTATLTRVPFFAEVDPDFTTAIAERLNAEFYQPRDVIARRGAMGRKVYFIRSGAANVVSEKEELLDTLTEGNYFGQSCLLGPKVRQDNVFAVSYCNILTLLATDFHEVLDHFPAVRGVFQTLLFELNSQDREERRMSEHKRMLMRRPSSVIMLPELRRMGAVTPSSEERSSPEVSAPISVVDAGPKSSAVPSLTGSRCSRASSAYQVAAPYEESSQLSEASSRIAIAPKGPTLTRRAAEQTRRTASSPEVAALVSLMRVIYPLVWIIRIIRMSVPR